jgi:hypothetical protein
VAHSQRSRLRSPWLAGLLLLVWLTPLFAPHSGGDDQLCAPLSAGEDTLRVRPDAGAEQPHHCVICHSIRSYRSVLSDCGPAGVTLTAEHAVPASMVGWHREPAFDRAPARAPPA